MNYTLRMAALDSSPWTSIIADCAARGVVFGPGLSDQELRRQESACEFKFPPDLAEFLQAALPTGRQWPNWRGGPEDFLAFSERVLDGILFDIEWNEFWAPSWGERPKNLLDARRVATELFKAAPPLIPIFAHRAVPSEHRLVGNPVLSVWQTDIIVYADSLANFLRFGYHPGERDGSEFAPGFHFWSELVDLNNAVPRRLTR